MQFLRLQPCDFKRWTRLDSWPIEQAAFILLGFEAPDMVYLRPLRGHMDHVDCDVPEGWADLVRALKLGIAHKTIPFKRIIENQLTTFHVTAHDLVLWGRRKKYEIPEQLIVFESEHMKIRQATEKLHSFFNEDDQCYPRELDIALAAWKSASQDQSSGSAKQKVLAWLDSSGHKLSTNASMRIAEVCNWEKNGGRPKSTE